MSVQEVFAYLHVHNAAEAIAFYERAFGAKEKFRLTEPSGRIGHAEIDLDGISIMLSDEYPELSVYGPRNTGKTSVSIHLHVDDADAMIQSAVEAGATLDRAPQDHFYGERSGSVIDPFGHRWTIGHHIEDVTPEEMQRRYDAMMQSGESFA